jgi:hypothetical protein
VHSYQPSDWGKGYIAEAPLYLDWLFKETTNCQTLLETFQATNTSPCWATRNNGVSKCWTRERKWHSQLTAPPHRSNNRSHNAQLDLGMMVIKGGATLLKLLCILIGSSKRPPIVSLTHLLPTRQAQATLILFPLTKPWTTKRTLSKSEITCLEKNGAWNEVLMSQSETRILPGAWVFRHKQTPDGAISK